MYVPVDFRIPDNKRQTTEGSNTRLRHCLSSELKSRKFDYTIYRSINRYLFLYN